MDVGAYETHNFEVEESFSVNGPGQLLVLDVSVTQNIDPWNELCSFLGHDHDPCSPGGRLDFPRANAATTHVSVTKPCCTGDDMTEALVPSGAMTLEPSKNSQYAYVTLMYEIQRMRSKLSTLECF
jgi:hypothetical protein